MTHPQTALIYRPPSFGLRLMLMAGVWKAALMDRRQLRQPLHGAMQRPQRQGVRLALNRAWEDLAQTNEEALGIAIHDAMPALPPPLVLDLADEAELELASDTADDWPDVEPSDVIWEPPPRGPSPLLVPTWELVGL